MTTKLHFLVASIVLLVGLYAYAAVPPAPKLAPQPDGFVSKGDAGHGKDLFLSRACSTCHGGQGNGQGIAGKALTPPPADFTDSAGMKARSDWRLFNAIKNGGEKLGLSASMGSYSDLSDQDIHDLIAYIRKFAK